VVLDVIVAVHGPTTTVEGITSNCDEDRSRGRNILDSHRGGRPRATEESSVHNEGVDFGIHGSSQNDASAVRITNHLAAGCQLSNSVGEGEKVSTPAGKVDDALLLHQLTIVLEVDGGIVVVADAVGNVTNVDLGTQSLDALSSNHTAHPVTGFDNVVTSDSSKVDAIVSGVQSASHTVVVEVDVATSSNSSFSVGAVALEVLEHKNVEEGRHLAEELILVLAGFASSWWGRRGRRRGRRRTVFHSAGNLGVRSSQGAVLANSNLGGAGLAARNAGGGVVDFTSSVFHNGLSVGTSAGSLGADAN